MDPTGIKELIELAGSIGAPAVAVILGMKYAINGMKADVREIKGDVKDIKSTVSQHTVEIAVLKVRSATPTIDE